MRPGSGKVVTYISPCLLHHLLPGSQERLQETPGLDHKLVASLVVTILHTLVQSIDVFDQTGYGIRVAGPGGEREINYGHVGRIVVQV